jgi:hypothetical protein
VHGVAEHRHRGRACEGAPATTVEIEDRCSRAPTPHVRNSIDALLQTTPVASSHTHLPTHHVESEGVPHGRVEVGLEEELDQEGLEGARRCARAELWSANRAAHTADTHADRILVCGTYYACTVVYATVSLVAVCAWCARGSRARDSNRCRWRGAPIAPLEAHHRSAPSYRAQT